MNAVLETGSGISAKLSGLMSQVTVVTVLDYVAVVQIYGLSIHLVSLWGVTSQPKVNLCISIPTKFQEGQI